MVGARVQRTDPTPLHVSGIYFDGKFDAPDQFYNNNTTLMWSLRSDWILVGVTSACVDDKKNPGWTREIRPALIRNFINRLGLLQL